MKCFMRKWILMIMMAILPGFLMATNCFATYLIELKNGTTIVTDHYWEENGQIRYYHLGGVVGVAGDMILLITDTDAPVPKEIALPAISELAPVVEDAPINDGVVESKEASEEYYKAALQQIKSEIFNYRDKFERAKASNQETPKNEAWIQLRNLKLEQFKLRDEVLGFYDGTLPDWWDRVLKKQND